MSSHGGLVRVVASDISTQDTSTDIAVEVTNIHDYEMRLFWQWTVSLLAAALQTVSYMLSKLAASVPVEAVFSTTDLILNGKRLVLPSSTEFNSLMTIMHTCLILNRQKTMNMNAFWFFVTLSLISSIWTLICPACGVLYLLFFVKSMPPDLVLPYFSILISSILELSCVFGSYI